jgi:hypothetical protein
LDLDDIDLQVNQSKIVKTEKLREETKINDFKNLNTFQII